MSYQVIARKWRPQTFEEVTGQEAITRTLRNAVEHDRLHHAYLFSGARGVGKTTTARLLAKALNCHKTDKPNPLPCSPADATACASCVEISESRSIDVLEFDAASHTKVEEIRDIILESININPARDRYKIFIIDEVHQLSNSSFNALLKTLEEPPPRVAFIMATTELHKVPDTILSRCQEFEFRTIATTKIFERLKLIAEAEKIDISDETLREIARSGEGSMRDAQSNFDQVISFSGEKIETADVGSALGIAGAEMLTRITKAIADNQPAEVLNVVDDLIGRGHDLRNFCRDLMGFFRDLLIFKTAGDTVNLLDTAVLSVEQLRTNSEPFSSSDLIRFFNSLSETESKLREATQPRYVLEIGLMKLVEMRRVVSVEKILERIAKLESALLNGQIDNSISEQKVPAASQEKKTLKIDFPLDEVPFPTSEKIPAPEIPVSAQIEPDFPAAEPKFEIEENEFPNADFEGTFPGEQIAAFAPPAAEPQHSNQKRSIADDPQYIHFLSEITFKLPPITSEELEHIEDNWLDADYERKLQATGDNLHPIANVSTFVEILIGAAQSNNGARTENANGSAAGYAPAKSKPVFEMPVFEEDEISNEIPVLPENPTDEELRHYAENHPLVKKALRIFRGKIIEVRKE